MKNGKKYDKNENNPKNFTPEEIEEIKREKLPRYLLSMIPDAEMVKTGIITGAILDDLVNPMSLSSSQDFSKHGLCLDDKTSLLLDEQFIPYVIEALQKCYMSNLLKFYKGDAAKAKAHYDDKFSTQKVDIIDLNDSSVISDTSKEILATKLGIDDTTNKIAKSIFVDKKDIDVSDEEKQQVLDALDEAKDLSKAVSSGATKEQVEQAEEAILENLKKVEAMLTGKIEENEPKITAEYLKEITEKHGPRAAQEELMRLKPEDRDRLLKELVQTKKLK